MLLNLNENVLLSIKQIDSVVNRSVYSNQDQGLVQDVRTNMSVNWMMLHARMVYEGGIQRMYSFATLTQSADNKYVYTVLLNQKFTRQNTNPFVLKLFNNVNNIITVSFGVNYVKHLVNLDMFEVCLNQDGHISSKITINVNRINFDSKSELESFTEFWTQF